MTDGTAEANAVNYRLSAFYDLAKSGVIRIAWAQARELGPRGATAVALTPGWMRSEMMLGDLRRHRGALARRPRAPAALRHLGDALYTGRAVAALAADPDWARWNGSSLSSGGLAQVYGFTDVDGSRPDAWRYMVEVMDAAGRPTSATAEPRCRRPPAR